MEVRDVGQKMSHCCPPYSADMIIITVTIIIIVIISHFGGRERSGREDAKTQLEIVPGWWGFLIAFYYGKYQASTKIEKCSEPPCPDHLTPTIVSILQFWSHLCSYSPPHFSSRIFWKERLLQSSMVVGFWVVIVFDSPEFCSLCTEICIFLLDFQNCCTFKVLNLWAPLFSHLQKGAASRSQGPHIYNMLMPALAQCSCCSLRCYCWGAGFAFRLLPTIWAALLRPAVLLPCGLTPCCIWQVYAHCTVRAQALCCGWGGPAPAPGFSVSTSVRWDYHGTHSIGLFCTNGTK